MKGLFSFQLQVRDDLDNQLLNIVENKCFLNKPFRSKEIRSHLARLV